MNRRRIIVILLVVLVLAVTGVIVAVRTQRATTPHVWVIQRGTLEGTIELDGRVAPLHPIPITSSLDGRVQIIAVSTGDTVHAGDILVQLDRHPVDEQITQAMQQLEQAETTLTRILQDTQASTEARVNAEAQRRVAQAAYDRAQAALPKTLVFAPVDGIVTDITVAPGTPVSTGSVLVTLASLDDLGVTVTLDETDMRYLTLGQQVDVTIDAFPGQTFAGSISRISQAAQQQSGITNFLGQVTLTPQPSATLRPGMTATVHVRAILRQNVLLVPEQALHTVGQRTFVTIIDSTGRRSEREVTVGLRSNGMAEIASGVNEGEHVLLP